MVKGHGEKKPQSNGRPWYAQGLHFECLSCGSCCRTHGDRGEYAYVYLARSEIASIADTLSIGRAEFLDRYCTVESSNVHLRTDTADCPLLDGQGRCTVYPVRPRQCAAWPFWTENLVETIWNGPVAACCPGVGRGPLHTAEEIERIAADLDAWLG